MDGEAGGNLTVHTPSDGRGHIRRKEAVGASSSLAPWKAPSAGATMPAILSVSVRSSALGQRDRNELGGAARANPDQHAVLLVVVRGDDGFAHFARRGDVLAGDFENDVAFLET